MTEPKRPERGPMLTQPNRGPEPRLMSMQPSKPAKKPLGPFLRRRNNNWS